MIEHPTETGQFVATYPTPRRLTGMSPSAGSAAGRGGAPMRRLRSVFIVVAVATSLAMVTAAIATADQGGRPFLLELTGEAEVNAAGVPNQGDLDGTGTALLVFNLGHGTMCYDVTVSDVGTLLAAHVHVGPATAPGPVVIPTPLGATGGSGCVEVSRELMLAIFKNPENYYYNVHNADFPPGALRAQLR
jgi:hypothetical protein